MSALRKLGNQPFQLKRAEDLYFFNRLAPLGPILYTPSPLLAYRVRSGSLSASRLLLTESEVQAFELLREEYAATSDRELSRLFSIAFASKRRLYAKTLMGAGHVSEARNQLFRSVRQCASPVSAAKSAALLILAYLPGTLQPRWPVTGRDPRFECVR